MSDVNNLIRAVITDPKDNTVRLAYADAIEERNLEGDIEYAEFIRRRVKVSRNRAVTKYRDGWRFTSNGRKDRHVINCLLDPLPIQDYDQVYLFERRGFIDAININVVKFMEIWQWLIWSPKYSTPCHVTAQPIEHVLFNDSSFVMIQDSYTRPGKWVGDYYYPILLNEPVSVHKKELIEGNHISLTLKMFAKRFPRIRFTATHFHVNDEVINE